MMSALSAPTVLRIALSQLVLSPLNPRRHSPSQLSEDSLRPLGESMLAVGQKEFITVREISKRVNGLPTFELANGERRLRAAGLVGIESLEAIIKDLSDVEMLELMLSTGGHGEPLSPMAQAHGYYERMALENINQTQLAARLGISEGMIIRRLRLLELSAEAQKAVDTGMISWTVGALIASVPGAAEQKAFMAEVLHPTMQDTPLSYRAAVAARVRYSRSLQGAPFDLKDAALVPDAGACRACPYYAGNNQADYGDSPKKHTCMRPACYDAKVAATRAVMVEEYRSKGLEPLDEAENARAFPAGEDGLSYKVDLVEYHKPVPRDLLKAEVEEAPKWVDIANSSETAVVVRVGFDQSGKAVELVRVGEAICAADENEQAIFNEATRVRYGLEKQEKRVPAAAKAPKIDLSASDKDLLRRVDEALAAGTESDGTNGTDRTDGAELPVAEDDPLYECRVSDMQEITDWIVEAMGCAEIKLGDSMMARGEAILAKHSVEAEG